MLTGTENTSSVAMVSKGFKAQPSTLQMSKIGSSCTGSGKSYAQPNTSSKGKGPVGGGCTHCGNMKHTRETCFKLHGYPEWWHELKVKKKHEVGASENTSQATLVSTEPQLSLIPQGNSLAEDKSETPND
uniref:Uncharacterized protein n=1 Tax=Nelumbo nucifera TaxID=4432 RepID=A0A822XVX1_NELNU|nr:TPA_asm: hypothetical protein HUJ06_023041 [Nelumbo nucifera]